MSDITKAQLKKAIEDGVVIPDGHTIFAPSFYTDHFDLPDDVIDKHRSGKSHKSTIYANDGSIIPEVEGVYNLSFLKWLVCAVDLYDQTRDYNGRGRQAQEYVRVLRECSNEDE